MRGKKKFGYCRGHSYWQQRSHRKWRRCLLVSVDELHKHSPQQRQFAASSRGTEKLYFKIKITWIKCKITAHCIVTFGAAHRYEISNEHQTTDCHAHSEVSRQRHRQRSTWLGGRCVRLSCHWVRARKKLAVFMRGASRAVWYCCSSDNNWMQTAVLHL